MSKRITIKGATDQRSPERNDRVDENSINLVELATALLKRKKLIARTVFGVMVITAIVVLLIPNQYRSTASILPSGPVDKMSELKMLAGFNQNSNMGENSSLLFPSILLSQTVLDGVLEKTYNLSHDDREISLTLQDYFELDNPDKLRNSLYEIVSVVMDKKTAVVGLSLQTKYPELSQQILKEFLAQLENYNLHTRRSRARENAQYLATQLGNTRLEMTAIEDSLESFQQVNLDWAGSTDPATLKEIGRLKREVELKSQTYMYLTREYETARFDALKNVPIVRILDQPTLPTIKSGPFRTIIVLLSGIVTLIGMISAFVIIEGFIRKGSGPEKESIHDLRTDLVEAFPYTTRVVNRIRHTINRDHSLTQG